MTRNCPWCHGLGYLTDDKAESLAKTRKKYNDKIKADPIKEQERRDYMRQYMKDYRLLKQK